MVYSYILLPLVVFFGFVKIGFTEPVCPVAPNVNDCLDNDNDCNVDEDCEESDKCCSDGCNLICTSPYWQSSEIEHSGSCPLTPWGQSCFKSPPNSCGSDQDCPNLEKCCNNGCFFNCTKKEITPVNQTYCEDVGDCGSFGNVLSSLCPDGTFAGPYCMRNDIGVCEWIYKQCPPEIVFKAGSCPMIFNNSCSQHCWYDSDCPGSLKCCSNGCGFFCWEPVQDCIVGGYRFQICADPANLPSTFYNYTFPGIYSNWTDEELRCTDYAICTRNERDDCVWSFSYEICLDKLRTSPMLSQNTSVLLKNQSQCSSRIPCTCLSQPGCGWCQTNTTILTDTGPFPFPWGTCLPYYLAVKCTSNKTTGGYSGIFSKNIPSTCPNSLSGSFLTDPAGLNKILMLVNGGVLDETEVQMGIGDGDLVVKKILQATINGNTVRIHTLVMFIGNSNSLSSNDLVTYCLLLNKAYSTKLQISVNQLENCQLAPIISGMGLYKRAVDDSANEYLHSTDAISESDDFPKSGDFPLWIIGVIIAGALFFICLFVLGIWIEKRKKVKKVNDYIMEKTFWVTQDSSEIFNSK